MVTRSSLLLLVFIFLFADAFAQRGVPNPANTPPAGNSPLEGMGVSPILTSDAHFFFLAMEGQEARERHDQQEQPSEGVSMLDLKAPPGAKREFEKGVSLLFKKDLDGSVQHLSKAVTIYPKFVAAHNSLGTAYMDLG
jgi:hypothetical protein